MVVMVAVWYLLSHGTCYGLVVLGGSWYCGGLVVVMVVFVLLLAANVWLRWTFGCGFVVFNRVFGSGHDGGGMVVVVWFFVDGEHVVLVIV
jgi:hypothetical protein